MVGQAWLTWARNEGCRRLGMWLGAEAFVSFDRKAVDALQEQGVAARLL